MKRRETTDIHELIELLHVPVVENRLHLKIQELKSSEYENRIKLYRQRVETYRRILFENRTRESAEEDQNSSPLYWFELTKYKHKDWRVSEIKPEPPPFFDILEIIPDDIIQVIDLSLTNPDRVESKRDITSHLFGKHFDLEFVRCSANHACGTIRETAASMEKRHRDKTYTENEKLDIAFNMFFSYMRKFPSIREYFFNEFFSKIKLMCEDSEEDITLS
jgi:hypothetical protein